MKIISTEVEVECYEMHCDECSICTRAEAQLSKFESADRTLQKVFDEIGPAADRGIDWQKCDQEPWWTLAREFGRFQ